MVHDRAPERLRDAVADDPFNGLLLRQPSVPGAADHALMLMQEEADALGDSIAILHNARLRASGSSLFLKTTFGKGHTISIQSENEKTERVETIVKQQMPSAEIVATAVRHSGCSLSRLCACCTQLFTSDPR